MKIGYVLEQFPKLSETFILDEMLELERRGVELTVFALFDPREEIVHDRVKLLKAPVLYPPAGMEFIRLFRPRFWSMISHVGLKKWLWGTMVSAWLADETRKRQITHLHAHFAGDAAWVAMLTSKISKIPYSFTVHAGGIFGWPYLIKEKISGAKFVVSISQFNKNYLVKKYHLSNQEADKIWIIHCGVDLSQFTVRQLGSEVVRRVPQILTVARLEEKKGHRYLLGALKILKSGGFDFEAKIVGGGVLELEIDDCATFIGPLTQNKVRKLLEEADVFVLPCVKAKNGNMDGIPVSLMEAMAVGVPVISTKLSGIPELIEDGRSGLLVEPEDSSGLARAIERVLTSSELRSQFVKQARAKIEEEFDVRKNAQKLRQLLLR